MNKNENCKHDFLAVLHCKRCKEQFHVNWLEAVKQAKLDAVAEVMQRTKTAIESRSTKENKKAAAGIALGAIQEVKEVYEESVEANEKQASNVALEMIKNTEMDYKGTIS